MNFFTTDILSHIKKSLLVKHINLDNDNDLRITNIILRNGFLSCDKNIRFSNMNDEYFLDKNLDFRISFDYIKSIDFVNSKIKRFNIKQNISDDINFYKCNNINVLDLNKITFYKEHNSLIYLQVVKCDSLDLVCNVGSLTNSMCINLVKSSMSSIHIIKDTIVAKLLLDSLPNFQKLENIVNGNISELDLIDNNISYFTKHNAQKIQCCNFDAKSLKSFIDVDKFIVDDEFHIRYILTYNNIICLLLNTCDKIIMYDSAPIWNYLFHEKYLKMLLTVKKIINGYLLLKNRKEFVMDCVLELIEAGYDEAAEL